MCTQLFCLLVLLLAHCFLLQTRHSYFEGNTSWVFSSSSRRFAIDNVKPKTTEHGALRALQDYVKELPNPPSTLVCSRFCNPPCSGVTPTDAIGLVFSWATTGTTPPFTTAHPLDMVESVLNVRDTSFVVLRGGDILLAALRAEITCENVSYIRRYLDKILRTRLVPTSSANHPALAGTRTKGG